MTFFAVPDIKLFLSLKQIFYQRWCFNFWNNFSQVINLFSTNQYLFLSLLHDAIIMTIMMTMISAMMMMYKIVIADHRFRYSLLYSLLGFFTTTLLEPYSKSKNPTRFSRWAPEVAFICLLLCKYFPPYLYIMLDEPACLWDFWFLIPDARNRKGTESGLLNAPKRSLFFL